MQSKIVCFPEGQRVIGEADGLASTLGTFVGCAVEAAFADAGSFYVVDAKLDALVPYVTQGLPPEYVQSCGNVKIGDQCCGRAVQHKKPWIVSDMLTDSLFVSARVAAEKSPVRAAFSVPVMVGNECVGSLACHYFRSHHPTQDDISRNRIWADLIGFTIREKSRKSIAQGMEIKEPPKPRRSTRSTRP